MFLEWCSLGNIMEGKGVKRVGKERIGDVEGQSF